MLSDDTALYDSRIIVPVRNGGARWQEAAAALRRAVPDPSFVVVVDSTSTDGSDAVARDHGFELLRIDPAHFNHGRTRQAAVDRFCHGKQFVIFLTQDAVIERPESLPALLDSFANSEVGAAYGRQLPHHNARPFEAHNALFNYPQAGAVRTLADAPRFGIKTAYISNSFAAYRLSALRECGGFPSELILGEDAHVALHMLLSGWAVSYRADAAVRHSHDYSIVEEMQRYFDMGVLHAQLPELTRRLGRAEGEGTRFVMSELRYIRGVAPWLLPEVVVRNGAKYLGYRLGRVFQRLPLGVCRSLSMTKGYWNRV